MVELSRYTVKFGRAKGLVYRREDSDAGVWYFRMFLTDEKRYIRKSLKTTDRREAIEFAEDELVTVLSKQKAGQPIISATFTEACRDFRLHDEKCFAAGLKGYSKQTLNLHNHYVRQVSKYIAEKFPAGIRTRMSEIDGKKDFEHYLDWRMMNQGQVRQDTVKAELIGVRMVFKLAVKNGKAPERSIPEWDFTVEDTPTRKRINTESDYPKVLKVLKAWVRKADGEVDIYNRSLLHHFFLILAQSGMRSGECKQLKWSDIQRIDEETKNIVVRVRKETSKVRKDRNVLIPASTGGKKDGAPINYLLRWRDSYARHKQDGDFIFSLYTKGSAFAEDPIYRGMMSLREDLKEVGMEWWDLYHNRHLFASLAILNGVPYGIIANAMGNSVSVVEKHYAHLITEISGKEIYSKRVLR